VIPKAIEDITITDLNLLIAERRTEDKTIEYKLDLPTNADSEKIPKLLKPVCSFGNTDGGDLIYGIRAVKGVPVELVGIKVNDLDQQKLSLEHYFQSGIEPQIRGVHVKEIKLDNDSYILVIRIPRSWTAPHRVKSNAKFYARNSAGCYELDVPQLKQAFLLTASVSQEIVNFRADRIASIIGGSSPVQLKEGACVVLHIFPLSSFTDTRKLQVQEYLPQWRQLLPAESGNINYRLNFDGIVVASGTEENKFRAYNQFFRNGVFECVRVYEAGEKGAFISGVSYEAQLLESFNTGLKFVKGFGYDPPLYVLLTFAGVKGFALRVGDEAYLSLLSQRPFDRDVYMFPDSEITSYGTRDTDIMRPLFDMVWNSIGLEKTLNFNEKNEWTGHR
jgi:Putative DNA-binding domain